MDFESYSCNINQTLSRQSLTLELIIVLQCYLISFGLQCLKLQGSRLTAFELVHDKIPATLIADSAAAALMKAGRVNAVIVGADRIAENGISGFEVDNVE